MPQPPLSVKYDYKRLHRVSIWSLHYAANMHSSKNIQLYAFLTMIISERTYRKNRATYINGDC